MNLFKNIIEEIKLKFVFTKVNSPYSKNKIDEQINVYNTSNSGLTYSEAKDLINLVVDQKLNTLKDEAETIYYKRINEFKNFLIKKISSLSESEIKKLREPDMQLTLFEATKISGRKQSDELRSLLANLVVNRIKHDKTGEEELKNIVYNEAILTLNKLTIDQLKIITLCYLTKYTSCNLIESWETYNNYLNKHIKPFLDFKNTNAEFQHIEYAGCGNTGIQGLSNWDLIRSYKRNYSFLFFNLIEKNQIDSITLPNYIKNKIIALDTKEDKYYIKVRNKVELENYLKENNMNEEILKNITSIYESHIKNEDEIKKKIMDETDIGKELIQLCEKSIFERLYLTTVGIAIGASYFEQVVGEIINIDIWIN